MVRIRAHYDGKVIVPDEPLGLSAGDRFSVIIVSDDSNHAPLKQLAALARTFEASDDWPADGAAEHDHYLYGTPKRGQ